MKAAARRMAKVPKRSGQGGGVSCVVDLDGQGCCRLNESLAAVLRLVPPAVFPGNKSIWRVERYAGRELSRPW